MIRQRRMWAALLAGLLMMLGLQATSASGQPAAAPAAAAADQGTWNDYEIRVVDQHYSVYRNGVLINEFDNFGGQTFYPERSDDPGTDGRRFASGYIGLQVHSTSDVVSYRDVRIKDL
ncbi:hypothetical protein SVIOM342S_09849 [Streptomyces violaceorubidus]